MREQLERIFRAGVAACHPTRVLPPHLPEPPAGETILLAVGKAAAAMAEVAEARYQTALRGVAVAPHGAEAELDRIELRHAAHPVPDEHSVAAAERLLALAKGAGPNDLLLVLLSGGASSLACLPGEGLSLAEKQALTRDLLDSGAAIAEINCVRRHLSRIKGGRLALAAARGRLLTLAISDVVGDSAQEIGSGPTVPDSTTLEDAKAILERCGIEPPARGWSETPKRLASGFRIVARNADALAAAAEEASRLGYRPVVLGDCEGEAREIGRRHAEQAIVSPPGTALISGGELTVAVRGGGRGGPNHEYALAAAAGLAMCEGIAGLACDSDGIDGNSGAAGAWFDGSTLARSGRDAANALAGSDTAAFFAALGDQFVTGPTGTNVNDLRIILVAP